jgi:hypothetical protein
MREGHKLQVSENKVLRLISGFTKDELSEKFRILYRQKLRDLCRSPSIVRAVKSRKLRRIVQVDRMRRQGMYREFSWGNVLGNAHLKHI